MKILNQILNIIFPSRCIFCKNIGIEICENCIKKCDPSENFSISWIFPIYDYRNPLIKKAIWFLKYKGKKQIAHFFAYDLHSKIMEELSEIYMMENFRNPILIPIPIAPQRLRERGYNQSLVICKNLIKLNKEKNFSLEKNILIKPKDTVHQATIKEAHKRLKNIVGSFSVKNPEKIKERNIILIDDVTTTGATLKEAKRVLKEAGARKIIAFTIAH